MTKWQLFYPDQDIATHLNITCFNTNDNEDSIIFTISDPILTTQEISITGFTDSTKYKCCITVSSNIRTSQNVCQNVTLFNKVEQVSYTQCPIVTQCEHSMTITIYQSQIEITPSATSQQIVTESVILAPNVEERDVVSPIIGGVIGFVLGVTTVVIIWIIIHIHVHFVSS